MVHGFVGGMAGISALARLAGARATVVDMGVAADLSALARPEKSSTRRSPSARPTWPLGPAMTASRPSEPSEAGIEVVEELADTTDLFGTGDMGIANTTPSTAVVAVLTGQAVAELTAAARASTTANWPARSPWWNSRSA